jgi:hypothetical protein
MILSEFCVPRWPRSRPTLRLPYSTYHSGISLPPLFQDLTYSFSLFDCLNSVFSYKWHFHILFLERSPFNTILRPCTLIYLFSASLWDTNLRFLQVEIKRLSFDDILQPTTQTNKELHYNRRDLVLLRDGVIEALDYIPNDVAKWYESRVTANPDKWMRTPSKTLIRILSDEEKLSQFLMDSFQLLLSSLSTRDSQTSLEQATRGQRLTQLAFIYVPLSFVTGIYGMNLKELNDSPLSVWVMVVSTMIVIACTICAFWFIKSFEEYKVKPLSLQATGDHIRSWLRENKITRSTTRTKSPSTKASRSVGRTGDLIGINPV